MKSRMPRWARQVHHMVEIRYKKKLKTGRTKVKEDLEEKCLRRRIILKAIFYKNKV